VREESGNSPTIAPSPRSMLDAAGAGRDREGAQEAGMTIKDIDLLS